jgi:hypothetical protein
MCLQKKLHAKSKKAKEDVVCYKVVNQDLSALVFPSFKYKLNEMAQSGLISNDYVVFEGLHSFANKEEAMAFCKCLCKKCVIECVIPEGADYFEGLQSTLVDYNDIKITIKVKGYASNKLIPKEIIYEEVNNVKFG